MAEILCWSCSHRRAIPGNCHIRCAAYAPDGDPLGALVSLLMPAGHGRANFDPNFPRPVVTCAHFARVSSPTPTAARTETTA